MKLRTLLAAAVISIPCCQTGCVTESTRTITTDKNGTVTDTTVVKKGTDPAALKLVEVAAYETWLSEGARKLLDTAPRRRKVSVRRATAVSLPAKVLPKSL